MKCYVSFGGKWAFAPAQQDAGYMAEPWEGERTAFHVGEVGHVIEWIYKEFGYLGEVVVHPVP